MMGQLRHWRTLPRAAGKTMIPMALAFVLGQPAWSADEPLKLTRSEMDRVTASGSFSFDFTKSVAASNIENVFGTVTLGGSLLQSTADVQGSVVQVGAGDNDLKTETSTFAAVIRLPGISFAGMANFVQANSLSFIAFETD